MEYRWIIEINKFKDIAAEWDDTLIVSGEDNPFLLSDFIVTWWKHYSSKRKLMVFVAYDNGRIISGIPLCISKKGIRNLLGHVGGHTANLTHHLSINKQFNFMDYLVSSLKDNKEWDIFILERVLEDSPIISQCLALRTEGLKCDIYDAGFDGVVDLTKGYDFVVDNLSERLRRYLQSGKKKALIMGELRLNKISGDQNVRNLFAEFREISIKSFRMRGAFSAFEDNNYSFFFAELFEVFDKKGGLDAHRLSAGNETLAISFGYRFGKGFKWILTTFNPDFYELRPGYILIDALIQESIANGDPYFDMYYGGEVFYKQQWCNKMLPLKKIIVYRDNPLNRFCIGLEKGLRSNRLFIYPAKKIYNFIQVRKYNTQKNG